MKSVLDGVVVAIILILSLPSFLFAQAQPENGSTSVNFATDYPRDRAGVMIQGRDWVDVEAAAPAKTRAKHRIAASLSYGAVPATVVAEYEGLHAKVTIDPGRPVICLCHLLSLPGTPALARLHPKKTSRELDGGRMSVLPVVGGSKNAGAKEGDLIAVDVSQPEHTVWLVRPRQPLPPREYALMLGAQNISIFPFTVAAESIDAGIGSGKQ
jgi:hypothetical protein